jgi:hypothetical protein
MSRSRFASSAFAPEAKRLRARLQNNIHAVMGKLRAIFVAISAK